ncbi:hypothetical protein [Amycolatopsis sp. NPDC054798]
MSWMVFAVVPPPSLLQSTRPLWKVLPTSLREGELIAGAVAQE